MKKTVFYKNLSKAWRVARTMAMIVFMITFRTNPSFAIETNIPDLGQHAQSVLSTHTEQIMGSTLMQKINGTDFVINDPVVNEYLAELAAKFTLEAGIKDYSLHFFALNTPEVNAFAFFGGHIAIHSGLFMMVQNESEMAAVLAHETAHIAQHHLARMLANSQQRMPLTFAQIIAAVAIGVLGGSPEAGAHLATAALAGHMQNLINFTREHEHEADRIGMKILAKSNFNPAAMASVFHRMKQSSIYYDHPPEYLLTHPVFDARIADAQNRAASLSYQPKEDNLLFYLSRARLDAHSYESSSKRIERIKKNISNRAYSNKIAADYGYALALIKSPRHKEGYQLLKNLAEQHPHWAIEVGLAEAEQVMGETEQATQRLKHLNELHPSNYGIILQYASILLEQKKASDALRLLQPQRKRHFEDPVIHQMLARTFSMVNHKTEVHRSQAEWHFCRGQSKEAFKQLDLALESAQSNDKDSLLIPLIKERRKKMKYIIDRQHEAKI